MKSLKDAMESCVYNEAICCKLPAICGGVPKACQICGWNGWVDAARKNELRTLGRIITKPKKPEGGEDTCRSL